MKILFLLLIASLILNIEMGIGLWRQKSKLDSLLPNVVTVTLSDGKTSEGTEMTIAKGVSGFTTTLPVDGKVLLITFQM